MLPRLALSSLCSHRGTCRYMFPGSFLCMQATRRSDPRKDLRPLHLGMTVKVTDGGTFSLPNLPFALVEEKLELCCSLNVRRPEKPERWLW